jgi:hypothetical protein
MGLAYASGIKVEGQLPSSVKSEIGQCCNIVAGEGRTLRGAGRVRGLHQRVKEG